MRTLLLAPVLLLAGCIGETGVVRDPSASHARFTYCMVTTKRPDVEEDLKDHASAHYHLISHEDARDQHVTGDTLVLELKGDHGLQGSSAIITLRSLTSRRPLTTITVQRGFFYGGMDWALRKAMELLDPELINLSAKDHPAATSSANVNPQQTPAPATP